MFLPPWVLGTSHRVLTCGNALYDLDGSLLQVNDVGSPMLSLGESSLWSPTGTLDDLEARGEAELGLDDRVLRDEDLRRTGLLRPPTSLEPPSGPSSVLWIAPGRVRVLAGDGVYEIDLGAASVRLVDEEACAGAHAIGTNRSGALQCIVPCDGRACLRTLGEADVAFGSSSELVGAAWDRSAHRWLVASHDAARWLDESGAVLETRTVPDANVKAISAEGVAIVVHGSRTELWRFADGRTQIETLFEAPAEDALFAGEQIVIRLPPENIVWLARGAPGLGSDAAPSAPEGFEPLEPAAERNDEGRPVAVFRGPAGTTFPRSRTHIAAFVSRESELFVSRIDAVELSRFRDDTSWARAVAARYMEGGEERWARSWRDADGRRVLRGHSFIGGCERVHVHILVRERESGSEMWKLFGDDADDIERALGTIPTDAVAVPDAERPRYAVDPSIGASR